CEANGGCGDSVNMSGYFYRLKPVDFRLRSQLGAIPGANIADWPIRYEDLAPYYDLAEEELRVSGAIVPHPFAEPRAKPYPLPPLKEHPIANEVDNACRALGYHPLPTARGIISEAYRGRGACAYCALCGSYGCEVDAKSGTNSSLIPAASATGNVEIRPRGIARTIGGETKGKAKSGGYLDPAGGAPRQPAEVIGVVC